MKENFLQRSKNLEDSLFSMRTEIRHFFKIILLGAVAVGKTSIMKRYCEEKFESEYSCTLSADYKIKSILIDHNSWVEMNIWDTCGQEKYKNLTKQYYKNSKGCILVFDITDENSFKEVESWIEDLRENGDEDTTIIIVGNKADNSKERRVSFQQGADLAKKFKYDYIETSAKNDTNINIMFEILCKSMIQKTEEFELKRPKRKSERIGLYNLNKTYNTEKEQKIRKKGCC
jgi:small GTP-binding protein